MKLSGTLSILVEHMKVDNVLEIVEKDGLFNLRDWHDRILNFEKS